MRMKRNLVVLGAVAGCVTVTIGSAPAAAHTTNGAGYSRAGTADPNYAPLPAKVAREIGTVSPETLKAIGPGKTDHGRNLPPRLVKAHKLASHGKPELAYILGEFCPYCAAESWSLAVALARFGTFHGLTTLTSSANDHPPSIKTISFRYSRFRSHYLAYDPIVNEDASGKRVQTVPAKLRRAWKHFDPDGYPFIDFGGKAVITKSSFDPTLLAKLSRTQIAADLNQPSRQVAKAVDGTANQITAAICLMTNDKPRKVCDTKTISAIQHSLRPSHAPKALSWPPGL
jgi:Domain of unknown function (DUF929)